MSGGCFDGREWHCSEIADDIEQLIWDNADTGELPPEIIERFKEAVRTLRRAGAMAHRIDYLVCGDDGPDAFLRRWDEDLDELNLPVWPEADR